MKLIKNKLGYYQTIPLPSDEDLAKYYADKYYQNGKGSYEIEYDDEELSWKKLNAWLIAETACKMLNGGDFLDVGCGEGDLLSEFSRRNFNVKGFDFSKAGIQKINPELLHNFTQGNIFNLLDKEIKSATTYQCISLMNVLEHVKYPEVLLDKLYASMNNESILIIKVPNDFSTLHNYLSENKITKPRWWVSQPDHLSYFNLESMSNTLKSKGFELIDIISDNPIDLNLLNANSNYISDPSKGKTTHKFRIKTDNFLASINKEKLRTLFLTYGSMGVGRNLTYFVKKAG